MSNDPYEETLVERRVTYALETGGRFVLIANVPVRVCLETGEQFFSPDTVEKLQRLVWQQRPPTRVIETPVYDF